MKTTSKLLVSLGLSLLAIGVIAQKPSHRVKPGNFMAKPAKMLKPEGYHRTHRITSTNNYLIDNLSGDITKSGGTFYSWQPYLYLNANYNNTDTGLAYNYAANDVAVAFDTLLFDDYSGSFVGSLPPGGVEVDTISAFIQYHNNSGNNDTIWFYVNGVTAEGYADPTTVYGGVYLPITPTTLTYNEIDSTQFIELVLPSAISIPSSARNGWNFSIYMIVTGDKTQDSIALTYYSQGSTACAAYGGYYTPYTTSIGVGDSSIGAVNTIEDGLWWFDSPGQSGFGSSVSWPTTSGNYKGYCINNGLIYWNPFPLVLYSSSCIGDTSQWPIQDGAIFPSISVIPTGTTKLASAGLTVNQNYPNPFNQTTQITYSLVNASDVVFTVNDITGRELVNNSYGSVASGSHVITLSANSFSPGVYFYTFNINGNKVTKKMVITE